MWSVDKTIPQLESKSNLIKQKFADVANAALAKERTEDEAILAGLAAINTVQKSAPLVQKPNIPSHLAAVLNRPKPSEVQKNKLPEVQDALISADFDAKNRLVLTFSSGKKIITKPIATEEYVENYISVSPSGAQDKYPWIQFDTENTAPTIPAGMLTWDAAEGTLSLGMNGGDIIQQIGLEQYYRVKNQSGSTILDGTVVMFDGSVGNSGHIKVKPAFVNDTNPPQYTMGILTHTLLNGENGFTTSFGIVHHIDTTGASVGETWLDGDVLFLHPSQPGKLTKVKPPAPAYHVMVALVLHAHTNGHLFVRPTYGQKLRDNDDVVIQNPVHGDVLKYDQTTSTWKNQPDQTSGDAPELNPVFTYNVDSELTRIDYASGNYKLFTYSTGTLTQLDYVKGVTTYRKTFIYDVNSNLTSIVQTIL